MEAQVEKQGEVLVIHLRGKIDFEATEYFEQACRHDWRGRKLIFNMADLNFVGSQGITPFMDCLLNLGRNTAGYVKLCGLRAEFRRLFDASQRGEIEIFDDTNRALMSFEKVPQFISSDDSSTLV